MPDIGYARLHVKAFDGGAAAFTFSGIASTPDLDRQGHIVDPNGITFTNPLPLLWHHDRTQPIGTVQLAAPTPDGVAFTATIPTISEPGRLRDRCIEAAQSVAAGFIRGVSIGFQILKDGARVVKNGQALKLSAIEVLEVSLVTIPSNRHATIFQIKSAAMGTHPPDTGTAARKVIIMPEAKPTNADQIKTFENSRAAKVARLEEIMTKASGDGATLDEQQTEEYDGLEADVSAIDAHLTRLRQLEKFQVKAATPIAKAADTQQGSQLRSGIVQVKSPLPQGTAFVRAACAMLVCKGNFHEAASYAHDRWNDSSPEVELYLKAAVAAGNTTDATWASPLVNQNISSEFLALLRPATILGKIPGLRTVPFNTKVPSQTAGGTYGWVGEAKPKPVTKLAFSAETLGIAKAAGIIVLTEELVRLSNPSAEALVRQDMIAGIAQFLDQQFIDPAVAAVAGVNPASITNGAPTAAATTNPLADILGLINHFASNNIPVDGVTFIMSASNALSLSFYTNSDGSPMFPGVSLSGGSYKGINIVTSQAAAGLVIAVQPGLVLYADDGAVTIDASREASLQMDSAPASPPDATTVFVNLWQMNCVGLRAERFVNWKRANANAVKYLTAAAYPAPAQAAAPAP